MPAHVASASWHISATASTASSRSVSSPAMHSIADIEWKPPAVEGAAWFAHVDGVSAGYVTQTPHADGRWRAVVTPEVDRELRCYTATEGKAIYLIERYLSCHMPDVRELDRRRRKMRETSGALPPRKPKGSDDRS